VDVRGAVPVALASAGIPSSSLEPRCSVHGSHSFRVLLGPVGVGVPPFSSPVFAHHLVVSPIAKNKRRSSSCENRRPVICAFLHCNEPNHQGRKNGHRWTCSDLQASPLAEGDHQLWGIYIRRQRRVQGARAAVREWCVGRTWEQRAAGWPPLRSPLLVTRRYRVPELTSGRPISGAETYHQCHDNWLRGNQVLVRRTTIKDGNIVFRQVSFNSETGR